MKVDARRFELYLAIATYGTPEERQAVRKARERYAIDLDKEAYDKALEAARLTMRARGIEIIT